MRRRLLPTLLIVMVVGLAWASSLDLSFSIQLSPETNNYEASYTFTVQSGYYESDHTLYVSLPPSLNEYYQGSSHTVINERDYVKFVTPNAVESVAENMRSITRSTPYDDEAFANAVLEIVRGITYVRSSAKYPVETLVDNQADCDGLSLLAASIMKAGGLDVVLLLYKGINPTHMNVGVYLEQMPASHSWWIAPSGIDFNNKTYWIAECTSLAGWTVGDRPQLLVSDKPDVISLEKIGKTALGSVSSSLSGQMQPSSISINLSAGYSNTSDSGRIIDVSGSITPAFPNESVTVYVNQPGYVAHPLVALTDEFGNYTLPWNVTLPGTYIIRTSWNGYLNFSGSDSEIVTVFVSAQQPAIAEFSSNFLGTASDAQSGPYSPISPVPLSLFTQGAKEFFKSNLTGTDAALSGEFMVLSDGRELALNETTVTIPAHKSTYRLPRSRRTVVIEVPEETVPIPGIEQLFGQFGFMLERKDEDNYTASVRVLTSDDVSQITQSVDERTALVINASEIARKNVWHKALAKVSDDEIAVEVFDNNGTSLDRVASRTIGTNLGELGVVMTYFVGQVLAFKNLKVEALNQAPLPPINNDPAQGSGIEFLVPYVRASLLLAGSAMAVICLRDRKKSNQRADWLESSRD